jgi:pimeloyl-ACP methyl ester carboxylesterase
MPSATVNGVAINYQVLGNDGPWILLTQGGRQDLELFLPLAENFVEAGYRVIVHDRRNSGGSDVSNDAYASEDEIFADDMHALCEQLEALPLVACGGAGGTRHSILMTLRHPGSTRALLLWWPSGSRPAAENLAETYYGQYIPVAKEGGMAAVAETPYYAERIRRVPANRDRLLSWQTHDFIDTMTQWRDWFLSGADMPVIGVTEETVRGIALSVCIMPGGDMIHPRQVAEDLARILPNAEFHDLPPQERPEDEDARRKARLEHQRRLSDTFIAFLKKHNM